MKDMRTAEETRLEFDLLIDMELSSQVAKKIERAIKSAKIDTIKECAELAKLLYEKTTYTPTTTKAEILKLIDQVK